MIRNEDKQVKEPTQLAAKQNKDKTDPLCKLVPRALSLCCLVYVHVDYPNVNMTAAEWEMLGRFT